MNRRHVWLLRASSAWVFYVWGVLVRNMIIDKTHTWAFRAVHMGLAVISSAFAGGVWLVSNRISESLKTPLTENSVVTTGGERDQRLG